MFLNTRLPPFNDVRVRRALNYAVDRESVVRAVGGQDFAQPTCQFLPPGFAGYRPYCPFTIRPAAGVDWSGPDLAKSRRLVEQSGTRGTAVIVWIRRIRLRADARERGPSPCPEFLLPAELPVIRPAHGPQPELLRVLRSSDRPPDHAGARAGGLRPSACDLALDENRPRSGRSGAGGAAREPEGGRLPLSTDRELPVRPPVVSAARPALGSLAERDLAHSAPQSVSATERGNRVRAKLIAPAGTIHGMTVTEKRPI